MIGLARELWHMIRKEVTRLRLALSLAALLALFGMTNLSAGLLLTVEALPPVSGSEVDYQARTLTIKSNKVDYRLASGDNAGKDLYLTEQSVQQGWKVSVFDDLGSDEKIGTSELLRGSLESVTPVENPYRFDFLLKDNRVTSGDLARQIGSAGLFVQVAGLDEYHWSAISQSLAALEGGGGRALAASLRGSNNPAIPLPGTLALLLFGTVSLAASRRRR